MVRLFSLRFPREKLAVPMMIAALVMLAALAALQYRWIGQLSQAEQERMRAGVRMATVRFSQEFNGEIARAHPAFQGGRYRTLEDHAERFTRWTNTTSHPQLIQNYYLTQGGEGGTDEILVLNRTSGLFEATAWPEALGTLRTRLHSRWRGFRGLSSGPPEETPPLGGPGGGMAGIFEEESPVLIAPRFRPRLEGPRGGSPIEGWVIAELNKTYLEKEYLPELVHKYFAGSDGLDYQVRIVSNSKLTDVIYQSDPGLPESFFASADATGGLFPPRPDFQRGAGPGFGRMRPGGEAPSGGPPEPRGRWRVLVKHHSGSLESAVAQARARNLAISFAVLLFMAGGVAMLLITTQRAQRLARLQMEFVAGVSHELRTPLTVICSAGDNLADGLVANEQQVRRYGSVIRNEGRRLSEMVEQILGFAGLQAGRTRYAVQPVDLSEVVERALAVCDPGCEVDNQMAPDLPRVLADPTSLTHCVRNLLSNAEKYGNGSGWIGIRAESASNAVELRIEDRGPGIDPADLPHIFEPFYRGRQAIADQIHGAGLGLSLVRRIIEAHGGSVSASSTPGQGSCFTLRIPAAAGALEQPVESHGAENPAR